MNKACHIMAIKKVANGKTHISIDVKHNELMDELTLMNRLLLSLRISKMIILSSEPLESFWLPRTIGRVF